MATLLLAFFAPSAKDYEVSSIQSLPDEAQSIIANEKVDHYFSEQDGIPAILVFQANNGELTLEQLVSIFQKIEAEKIDGLEQVVPLLAYLQKQQWDSFLRSNNSGYTVN